MDMDKVINDVFIYSFWAMNQPVSDKALCLFLMNSVHKQQQARCWVWTSSQVIC